MIMRERALLILEPTIRFHSEKREWLALVASQGFKWAIQAQRAHEIELEPVRRMVLRCLYFWR